MVKSCSINTQGVSITHEALHATGFIVTQAPGAFQMTLALQEKKFMTLFTHSMTKLTSRFYV